MSNFMRDSAPKLYRRYSIRRWMDRHDEAIRAFLCILFGILFALAYAALLWWIP